MLIEYKKEFQHKYVLIKAGEIEKESYPMRMLLGGAIKELLPCKLQYTDGEAGYCYEITGSCSLEEYLEGRQLSGAELKILLEGILHMADELERYLLSPENLILKPETIYYMEGCELRFCYIPREGEAFELQLQGLLEYLLPLINHQDESAVSLGYSVYKAVLGNQFGVEKLRKMIYEQQKEEPVVEQEETEAERTKEDMIRRQAMDDFFCEEMPEEKTKVSREIPWESVIVSALWTVALLGVCALKYIGILDFLTLPVLLGIVLVTLVVLGINLFLWKDSGKEREYKVAFPHEHMAQGSIQWPGKQAVEKEEVRKAMEEKDTWIPQTPEQLQKKALGDTQPLPCIPQYEGEILISQNPEKSPNIPISQDLLLVGKREDTVDVVLDVPTISRVHARIRKVGGEIYLMDLQSRNGTYVNGQQLQEKENRNIVPGDSVVFADVEYVLATA